MSKYVPRASTQAALGLLQADKAYRVARWHTSQGVPPEIAIPHAIRASRYFMYTWFLLLPSAAILGLFYWTDNVGWLIWKASVVYMSIVLWHRQKIFLITDPRLRLRYTVGTSTFVGLLCCAWVTPIYLMIKT